MLNLTNSAITLLAESGETTEIPASGYIARVEMTRKQIPTWDIWGNDPPISPVPLIEETPTEIVVADSAYGNAIPNVEEAFSNAEGGELFLVTREVAEAAHALGHSLWRRMVWAVDHEITSAYDETPCPECGTSAEGIRYHALRRVPQGETHA